MTKQALTHVHEVWVESVALATSVYRLAAASVDESATIILARFVETAAFSETRTDSVLAAADDSVAASPACANDMSVLIAEDTEAVVWARADDSAAAVLVEASAAAVAMAALLLAVASFAALSSVVEACATI